MDRLWGFAAAARQNEKARDFAAGMKESKRASMLYLLLEVAGPRGCDALIADDVPPPWREKVQEMLKVGAEYIRMLCVGKATRYVSVCGEDKDNPSLGRQISSDAGGNSFGRTNDSRVGGCRGGGAGGRRDELQG